MLNFMKAYDFQDHFKLENSQFPFVLYSGFYTHFVFKKVAFWAKTRVLKRKIIIYLLIYYRFFYPCEFEVLKFL